MGRPVGPFLVEEFAERPAERWTFPTDRPLLRWFTPTLVSRPRESVGLYLEPAGSAQRAPAQGCGPPGGDQISRDPPGGTVIQLQPLSGGFRDGGGFAEGTIMNGAAISMRG